MDNTGLLPPFDNDRPLTDFEREQHLAPRKRLDVPLLAQNCVVKMNSNYLISVDRWYGTRGFLALLGLVIVAFCLYAAGSLVWIVASGQVPNENGLWPVALGGAAVFAAIGMLGAHLAGKELFRWTYYPIALDRRHRMVHVFRPDGSTLSVPWDAVYFTLGRGKGVFGAMNWDVRGLVLDPAGGIVKETFAFGMVTGSRDNALGHWEFLRRYMEEGAGAVVDAVMFCMPLDGRREPAAVGQERLAANDAQLPFALYLMIAPFSFLQGLARALAMRTSRIPRWPDAVAATLMDAPGDPYARDASINPEDLR